MRNPTPPKTVKTGVKEE